LSLILASKSPRRKELLNKMGLEFAVVDSGVDELDNCVYPPDVPFLNAISKAEAVSQKYPSELILAADTIIDFNNKILGKPKDKAQAFEMLKELSGNEHKVITAVCLKNKARSIECVFGVSTSVFFRKLTEKDINKYLNLVNCLDKAGAYAIQEHGDILVEKIIGPQDNVIGLPCERLSAALQACGNSIINLVP
jgi:septum formation protein